MKRKENLYFRIPLRLRGWTSGDQLTDPPLRPLILN